MPKLTRRPWAIAATLVAAAFFAIACSDAIYEITSPVAFSFHIVLRKFYSIVAFTLVGYLLRRALGEARVRPRALVIVASVAAFSAAIELGQFLAGSQEGLGWNAIDTLCGGIGGALATADLWLGRPLKR